MIGTMNWLWYVGGVVNWNCWVCVGKGSVAEMGIPCRRDNTGKSNLDCELFVGYEYGCLNGVFGTMELMVYLMYPRRQALPREEKLTMAVHFSNQGSDLYYKNE